MPYPNEHACRLRQPNGEETRRTNGAREHEGKKYDVIFQKKKGSSSWEEQAYRYPKGTWDTDDARDHCRSHDGISFEAARGEESMEKLTERSYFKLAEKDAGTDHRYTIIASTKDIDRMGEIVEPRGLANLDRYLKDNPIILLNHNWMAPPVGKAVDGAISDDDVRLSIVFADTPIAREVRSLYDGGFMSAFSIGFLPLEVGSKSIDGVEHRVYNKWELMETSCVDVPANEGALIVRSAREKGLSLPALTAALWPSATPSPDGGNTGDRRSWGERVAEKWLKREGKA